jgi:hypothetical protein
LLGILRRVFDFSDWQVSHPQDPPPGDMLDASFDAQDNKINELMVLLESVRRSDGVIANATVTHDSIHPEVLTYLERKIGGKTAKSAEKAEKSASEADSSRVQAALEADSATNARNEALSASLLADSAQKAISERVSDLHSRAEQLLRVIRLAEDDLATMEADWQTSRSQAESWAKASRDWAEFMGNETGLYLDPNATIPPSTLNVMGITGDHWSSRWWANRADNAFGRLTDLYLGAWVDPPTHNLEGGPIQVGSIYYDTDDGQPYVWDGDSWMPFWAPNRAATSTLWYRATAGQTLFSTQIPDQNGNTFLFDQAHPEGTDVHVNGVKLTPSGAGPEGDYLVDHVASTVTLARPVRVGDIVAIDLLLSPEQLAPGSAQAWSLTFVETIDGSRTSFTLVPKAAGGPSPVNLVRSEEAFVSLDGVIQEPGVSYTALGANLTFTTPPEANSKVFVTWLQATPTGAAAALTFVDTCTRANMNLEDTPGSVWARLDGSAGMGVISANKLASTTTDGAGAAFTSPDMGNKNHWVEITLPSPLPASSGPFAACRLTDRQNYVGIRTIGTSVEVYKRVAGAMTALTSGGTTVAAGDVIRLECRDDTYTLKKNGVAWNVGVIGNTGLSSTRQGFVARSVSMALATRFATGLC